MSMFHIAFALFYVLQTVSASETGQAGAGAKLRRQKATPRFRFKKAIEKLPGSLLLPNEVRDKLPDHLWDKIDEDAEQARKNDPVYQRMVQMRTKADIMARFAERHPNHQFLQGLKKEAKKMKNEKVAMKKAKKQLKHEAKLEANPEKKKRYMERNGLLTQ